MYNAAHGTRKHERQGEGQSKRQMPALPAPEPSRVNPVPAFDPFKGIRGLYEVYTIFVPYSAPCFYKNHLVIHLGHFSTSVYEPVPGALKSCVCR